MARPDEGTTLLEQVIELVLERCACAACQASYERENVHVLEQLGPFSWLIALVCHECLRPRVLQVEAETRRPWSSKSPSSTLGDEAPGQSSAGEATKALPPAAGELTSAERRRMRQLDPLTADDLLDFVAFLDRFDGDLQAEVGPPSER